MSGSVESSSPSLSATVVPNEDMLITIAAAAAAADADADADADAIPHRLSPVKDGSEKDVEVSAAPGGINKDILISSSQTNGSIRDSSNVGSSRALQATPSVCTQGYVNCVGGWAQGDDGSFFPCSSACDKSCCSGNEACTSFTGQVCKDGSCSSYRACKNANISFVVNSCIGETACESAGSGGMITSGMVNCCNTRVDIAGECALRDESNLPDQCRATASPTTSSPSTALTASPSILPTSSPTIAPTASEVTAPSAAPAIAKGTDKPITPMPSAARNIKKKNFTKTPTLRQTKKKMEKEKMTKKPTMKLKREKKKTPENSSTTGLF